MSNLLSHAKRELNLIGMTEGDTDEMNSAMRKHILHIIQEFADERHSGFSASFAISILSKLMAVVMILMVKYFGNGIKMMLVVGQNHIIPAKIPERR